MVGHKGEDVLEEHNGGVPGEDAAVDGVVHEDASGTQHARHLGHDCRQIVQMLKDITTDNGIERGCGKGERVCGSSHVLEARGETRPLVMVTLRGTSGCMLARIVDACFRQVDAYSVA